MKYKAYLLPAIGVSIRTATSIKHKKIDIPPFIFPHYSEKIMPRINKAVELLSVDQPVYYTGAHSGHVLTYEEGKKDAQTWADYINIGMEHGCFDMTGLDNYIKGLIDGGPTKSGHKSPALIVELPVEGVSEDIIRFNAWQIRQILARGVHGICQAESPDAVRAFVESCRYPRNELGVGEVWAKAPGEWVLKARPQRYGEPTLMNILTLPIPGRLILKENLY